MSKTCQKRVYGIESLHPGRNPWGELTVRGQKNESLNGCFKKTKHAKFPEKRIFLPPWYALMFWDSPFCLITDKLFAIYVTFRLRNYGKKKIFGSTFWKRRFNIAMPTFVKFRLCLLWLSIQIWFTYCSLPIIFTTI